MKRLLLVAVALLCACVCAAPVCAQVAVTASLPNYAGATITATSLTNAAHSATATIGSAGGIALTLYLGDSYTFSVGGVSSSYPAFTTARTQLYSVPYRNVDISQALQAGAAAVYLAPAAAGAGSITGGACGAGTVVQAINSAGVPTSCVPAGAQTLSQIKATLATDTAPTYLPLNDSGDGSALPTPPAGSEALVSVNGHSARKMSNGKVALYCSADGTGGCSPSVVDGMATGGGNNALANAVTNYATGASILVSPGYALTEVSNYLTPAIYGNGDQYAQYPMTGGAATSWYAEDQRGRNRVLEFINPTPISVIGAYNERTPYVLEARFSHSVNYADNFGTVLVRQRIGGGTENYGLPFANRKSNFSTLKLDSERRSPGQGGGEIDSLSTHPAPGDDQMITVQHYTNGCSEGEDECNKLFRAFLETMTQRWGGTLNATPTVDAGGFGNYGLDVTFTGGYNPKFSAEGVWAVDLQRPYTAGNITGILTSDKAGMAFVTSDATANWATQFGTSTMTFLTAAVDNTPYTGCSQTSTTAITPDPMITTEAGIGGLQNRCVAVASSAGITAGAKCRVMGPQSNYEDVLVTAIPDATHITANFQKYHLSGENFSCGGMAGKGLSMIVDDIAPGGLVNYHTQPSTTLHKVFPILGNNSSGAYVYVDSVLAPEFSTGAYAKTTPRALAVVSGVTMSGTGVQSVNLSDPGSYGIDTTNILAQGQNLLSPPIVTFTGGSCTTQPVAHGYYNFISNNFQLSIAIDTAGVCSGTPTATLSTTWANPYRVVDLAFTRKIINPATGSVNDGHLLVAAINPANWHAGDLIEIPGFIHDYSASTRVLAKYYTGKSGKNGIADSIYFQGDWASPDTLTGILNNTSGYKYYSDATHPLGPGVAYEAPPNGSAIAGNISVALPIYLPPQRSLLAVGCVTTVAGYYTYHPCQDGIASEYDIFNNTDLGIGAHPHHLHYKEVGDLFSWDGNFKVNGNATVGSLNTGDYTLGGNGTIGNNFTSLQVNGNNILFTHGFGVYGLINSDGFCNYNNRFCATYNGDVLANSVTIPAATPTSASTCTDTGGFTHPANSTWGDDNYLYHCLSSGTSSKRVAYSAF